MKSSELSAITAIQAILDGLPKHSRRFVVKMVAEYESVLECQERIIQFGGEPNQTIARVP